MTTASRTYSGVLHVHTEACGGMPLDAIVGVARDTGVDFVVVTDGDRHEPIAPHLLGWHNGVLLIGGEKVYCPEGNFLAIGGRNIIGTQATLANALRLAREGGAFVVGIHYHYQSGERHSSIVPPPLEFNEADAIEVWCFLDEFLARVPGTRALQFQPRPERAIFGPPRELLRRWDRALRKGPVPVVGGLNARCRKEPLLDWKEFFPFRSSFRTVRTMVRCEELSKDAEAATHTLIEAMKRGSSYICNRSLNDGREFQFCYTAESGATATMGEALAYERGGSINVSFPVSVEFCIRANGLPLYWGSSSSIKFPAPVPGVYRVEAYIDRRVWLMSNALRLTGNIDDQRIASPKSRVENWLDALT